MWCNAAVLMSLLQINVDVCTARMTKCVEHMSVLHMHLTSTANQCESSEAPVTIHCNNAQRLAFILRPRARRRLVNASFLMLSLS